MVKQLKNFIAYLFIVNTASDIPVDAHSLCKHDGNLYTLNS